MTRLRLPTMTDSAVLAALLVHNRAHLAPWQPARADEFFTDAGQHAELAAALARYERGDAAPFVVLDDDDAAVGRLTLSGIVRGAFQSCTLSYWITRDRTREGLATAAVAAALTHAFQDLGLHRVQAETLVDNVGSQRVLERNGFRRYGLAPGYLEIAGRWQDHIMFQRLVSDA